MSIPRRGQKAKLANRRDDIRDGILPAAKPGPHASEWTQRWSRNPSDEAAIEAGCFFDILTGAYAVWWIERYCRLYEGEYAGEQLRLRGRHDRPISYYPIPDKFDCDLAIERAEDYLSGQESGVHCDWQYECAMRIMGWQKLNGESRWRCFACKGDGCDQCGGKGNRLSLRRFRKGSVWVPKKSKKSPTLASFGIYLVSGDGEQGNKVFQGAKDGTQARNIMGEHCKAMFEQSGELLEECSLNLNKMRLTHKATRSFLEPLSSSNSRTQESKEGLNGSVLIDETHVVDRAFIRRLSRMGISRAEPLQLEFSTAGNNPDGYGKSQFDYGAEVESGKRDDISFFYAAYCAPQDVKDDDIIANPVKYGQLANPAWGHTISGDEFLADFSTSQKTPTEWADFKMYRLNVWQAAAQRWIAQSVWDACGERFQLQDYSGMECVIGLDLSRTRDMTAAVLGFGEWDEDGISKIVLWPKFWLTEAYAHKHKDDAAFLAWAASGELTLTDGNEISIADVYSTLDEWSKTFRVTGLFYDPWSATPITQILEQGLVDGTGKTLIQPLGVTRYPVGQRSQEMSDAINEFESLCRQGKIVHPRNRVLDWQMGNAEIKDVEGRIRIVKPERMSIKKIDGAVASVMTFAGLMLKDKTTRPTYYETNEVEFV